MPQYTTATLSAYVQAYAVAGIDLETQIKANALTLKNAGAPSPRPQKAPPSGATPEQRACSDVAYILYQIVLLGPNVDPDQALEDYCANHEACFAS